MVTCMTVVAPALTRTPFTAAQFPDLGLRRPDVRRMLVAGAIRRVVTGAYVAAEVEDSLELRVAALSLLTAPGHVLVDRTAAWLHGVDTFTIEELAAPLRVETCTERGTHPTARRDAEGGTRDLQPHEFMRLGAIEVTTPLRTALDLGCRLRRREAFAALNGLAARHGFDAAACDAAVRSRYKGRRGVRQLRELIAMMDPRCESPRESWTLLAIRDVGLPAPEQQYWVLIDGVPAYRLDHAYPVQRVVVEYDGAWHDQSPEQRAADERRRAWLRADGWTVIVVKRGDFTGARLDAWLLELRRALAPRYSARRW